MKTGIGELRALAVRALKRMYRSEQKLFAFRLRRAGDRKILEGISRRYTATALIGLAEEEDSVGRDILQGQSTHELCGHLLDTVDQASDLGEVALTLWAARTLQHADAGKALQRLRAMRPDTGPYPTVEVAWSLTALSVGDVAVANRDLAGSMARRLTTSFNRASGLFPHWPDGTHGSWLRSHVSCFADLVYPIQALAHYHRATGDQAAIGVAQQCALRMCELQGPAGQWWWHYDVRTGRVIEQYPVYAVHQDAMAPMALFALEEAGGAPQHEAIDRSLRWLTNAPEIEGSLIDRDSDVIWQKVARREPGKLVRSMQAAASRLHSGLRCPGVNALFTPKAVDYESRPYHMGWILHAWPKLRVETWEGEPDGQG